MHRDIIRLVNNFVYKRFTTEDSCKEYFRDSMMSREDLVSELFVAVYDKLPLYDSTRGKLSTFIYVVCKTRCGNILRRNKYNQRVYSLDNTYSEDDNLEFYDCISTDEDIINDLIEQESLDIATSKINDVTRAYFFMGVKQKELADMSNTSQANVSRIINKDLKRIKSAIK